MMKNLNKTSNLCGDDKVFDACSLFGMMNLKGKRFSSRDPVKAIANMHDRGNGLGGGFAIYGLYPEYKDYYALHIMYLDKEAKERTERFSAKASISLSRRKCRLETQKFMIPLFYGGILFNQASGSLKNKAQMTTL